MPRRKNNQQRNSRRRNNGNNVPNNMGRSIESSTPMRQLTLKPIVRFQRTVTGQYDLACDGINPTVGIYNFSLNDLPNSSDFTALFQTYCIAKVKLTFRPEYTELTDAALVSNAVNVNLNSAIDLSGVTPTAVSDITQFQSCKSTGITKVHTRSFSPAVLMDSLTPCRCNVVTSAPSTNWWGFAYGIPPTGIAMNFVSTATFEIICAGAR